MEIEIYTEFVSEHFNHNAGSRIPEYWKAVALNAPEKCDGAYGMGHTEQDAIDSLMDDIRSYGLDPDRHNFRQVTG